MARLPRFAVGTIQPNADGTAMLWALMDALERDGVRVQSFLSRACFLPRDGATAITGHPTRHLDSWLMTEGQCRESFARGCAACDIAVIEGSFAEPGGSRPSPGGDLETLCDWLDLPRLAMIDTTLLSGCQLPTRPAQIDGLLLDRVRDEAEFARLETLFESLWNVPVLGWMGLTEGLRRLVAATPIGSRPTLGLCHALGSELAPHAQLDRIYRLAKSRKFPAFCEAQRRRHPGGSLRVAVAFDDAFHCYSADTLDLLELKGATVCDFSPLADERLPADCDIVYLGCGFPERFARQLAKNDCIMLSLKSHLASGRRVYAEGGGLAYLCHELLLADGERWPMVGAVHAIAQLDPKATTPCPAVRTMARDTWLSPADSQWMGYLNRRWSLSPASAARGCASDPGCECDVVQEHRAVGSRLHINLTAREDLLDRFFEPLPVATCQAGPIRPKPSSPSG
jgi:cobyrinic acid a,c-diamide synthase